MVWRGALHHERRLSRGLCRLSEAMPQLCCKAILECLVTLLVQAVEGRPSTISGFGTVPSTRNQLVC